MFESVGLTDWLTILAILLAPLVAIQVERYLQIIKERRGRKLNVFHTLMATRGTRLSPAHVEALNKIDLAFYGFRIPIIGRYISPADQRVQEAWRLFFDHLNSAMENRVSPPEKGNELFAALLTTMASALKFHFDPVMLRRGGYYPQGHADMDVDQEAIRKAAREILEGRRALKIASVPPELEVPIALPPRP